MPRFVVHYQNGANGSFYLADAPTQKDAERYARIELKGFRITRVDYAARWLSTREERLSASIRNGRIPNHTKELLAALRELQRDYIEAYGPTEATRIDRLMALTRRAAGQNVLLLPIEKLVDYKTQ